MKKVITVLQLYPQEMNIYGDWGNVLCLKKRLQWHGYEPVLLQHHPKKSFPDNVDLVVGGGGQDSGQDIIKNDLLRIGPDLHELAEQGVPMLMVCGLYQLFGRFFQTINGDKIEGIGLFKAETVAGPKRLIGNVVAATQWGDIVGYENHSGLTWLDADQPNLGIIKKGTGNNGKDKSEGAVYKNVIGTYLHGSLLPKNPVLADYLIERAALKKYGTFVAKKINDSVALGARAIARKRPR